MTGARRRLLRAGPAVLAALVFAVAPAGARGPHRPPRPEVAVRFVSMPDFFNADLGDVSVLPGWEPGDPNSMTPEYDRAIDVVLDAVEGYRPDFVTVAGDLVEGHWGEDVDNTGYFGPVGTEDERLRAITAAGNFYYGEWRDRFTERGLRALPLVGDHEIGDDIGGLPLDERWAAGSFRHRAVPTYKAVWADNFTRRPDGVRRYPLRPVGTQWEDTAYAIQPDYETLIVMLDEFRYDESGVQPTVAGGQLAWLRGLLRDARRRGVDNVIVQGHVPVLGPVRSHRSGDLSLLGGAKSRLWRLLKENDVDMYLCGEVHAVTAIDDGVVQVCHGGLIAWGGINFMVVTVYTDGTVGLEVKAFQRTAFGPVGGLWQTSAKRQPGSIAYDPLPLTVARGRYGPGPGLTRRTGLFRPYSPPGASAPAAAGVTRPASPDSASPRTP